MEARLHLVPFSALGFVSRAVAWGAVLFGGLRLDWVQQTLLVPLAGLQQEVACTLLRAPRAGIVVDPSCTGSDAMALCLAVTFAFPAPWRKRLTGCLLGLALILAVNTVRIATLSATVGNEGIFEFLHLYFWPAALIVVAAAYLFAWMNRSMTAATVRPSAAASEHSRPTDRPILRFVGLTLLLVTIYYLFFDLLRDSSLIRAAAHWVAVAAAWIMSLVGVEAQVSGGLLRTASGAFLVTPECVLTPVIPVYIAAVVIASLSAARRLLALATVVPLFLGLGIARLLVLALPTALVGSETEGVHAFYQMVAAVVAVIVVARRREGRSGLLTLRALAAGAVSGVAVGLLDLRFLRPLLSAAAAGLHLGHGHIDGQGALAILPAYQLGLLVALAVATSNRRVVERLPAAIVALVVTQLGFSAVVGEMATHLGRELPIVLIRVWSLAIPLLLLWWLVRRAEATADDVADERARYLDFWRSVGDSFPDLGGAASTTYYRQNEQLLFEEFLPDLEGLRVFKTDLWDEAKNTRILRWAAGRGALAHGADISLPTTVGAIEGFSERHLKVGGAVGDVRFIPFKDGAFEAVYSMGTIEHFAETEQAVAEIFRVVAPGGRAIIGVPNRWDPFLRPLLVAVLYRLGLYDYGLEKSYSRGALRTMCERAGFEVVAETGILFIPGWLRMLDLACHVWAPPLSRLTALAVQPFAWLYRTFPRLRRHGYLIAAVVTRPGGSISSSSHASDPSTKQ